MEMSQTRREWVCTLNLVDEYWRVFRETRVILSTTPAQVAGGFLLSLTELRCLAKIVRSRGRQGGVSRVGTIRFVSSRPMLAIRLDHCPQGRQVVCRASKLFPKGVSRKGRTTTMSAD